MPLFDLKGRQIWQSQAMEAYTHKLNKHFILDPDILKKLADGLYIMLFTNGKDDPVLKKFNRITRQKR